MRVLLIGDVHSTPESLGDCRKLIDYACDIAAKERVEHIVFLGDLYHTHSVVRVEVLNFWADAFAFMKSMTGCEIDLIPGNHDFAGEGLREHALRLHGFQRGVNVIDVPTEVVPGVVGVPYISHEVEFPHESINVFSDQCKTVLCHQTFTGAKYENGMYAPDGIDPDILAFEHIVSGHIHTPQAFGRVEYIGSPRWQTINDANIDRAIWVYEFDEQGSIKERKSFSTNDVCRQIRTASLSPGVAIPTFNNKDAWAVDLRGPASWIEEVRPTIPEGVRVRAFPDRPRTIKVKESDGLEVALNKYLEAYEPKHGTPKDLLTKLAKERLNV